MRLHRGVVKRVDAGKIALQVRGWMSENGVRCSVTCCSHPFLGRGVLWLSSDLPQLLSLFVCPRSGWGGVPLWAVRLVDRSGAHSFHFKPAVRSHRRWEACY